VIFKLIFTDEYSYSPSFPTAIPVKNSIIKQNEGIKFLKYLLTHELPLTLHVVIIQIIYLILLTNPVNIVALEQHGLVEAILIHFTCLCLDFTTYYMENTGVLVLGVEILQVIQLIGVINSEKDGNIMWLLASITMAMTATATGTHRH
jgi:hypothetical protein